MMGLAVSALTSSFSRSSDEAAAGIGVLFQRLGAYILTGEGEDDLRAVAPGGRL
jgi:hypothetical protein